MKRIDMIKFGMAATMMLTWGCAQLVDLPEGEFSTQCATGTVQCAGNAVQRCVSGVWVNEQTCAYLCANAACTGECVSGEKQCAVNVVQECKNGEWEDQVACVATTCLGKGVCTGVCAPGDKQCDGSIIQACSDGQWANEKECLFVCSAAACSGECKPGDTRCAEQTVQTCSTTGQWEDTTNCAIQAKLCIAAVCIATPPSCALLPMTCGPSGNENCCVVTEVPGGTYDRGNDPAYPATVADFSVDRFEITVGRFRKFVDAYPLSKPAANTGAHPLIAGSEWKATWNGNLPADQSVMKTKLKCWPEHTTWTDDAGPNENLPLNCIDWYMAFAFCIWDGGRLPTEAEWNYAAVGGAEQRVYPWSTPPSSTTIDGTYAAYGCLGDGSAAGQCVFADILPVGSKSPKGDGRWGQADLAGSAFEWTLDLYDTAYPSPCMNCANMDSGMYRVFRGAGWDSLESVVSMDRSWDPADTRYINLGARCARNP